MKRILILFLPVILLGKLGFPQQKILGVIGSSTAAGTAASTEDSTWVNRVINFYNAHGIPDRTVNIAFPGTNCYDGMPTGYTPPNLPFRDFPMTDYNITKLLSFNPNVVIVNYPSNWYDVFKIAEVLFCLDSIRKVALAAGKICYIATTQPRSPFSDAGRDTLRRLKDSILQKFGPFAIDFWTGLDSSNNMLLKAYDGSEGIHLNDRGHALLAQRVLAKNIFSTPLPVHLLNFSALFKNDRAYLQWETVNESFSTSYWIERSTDGSHFQALTNRQGLHRPFDNQYAFTDDQPVKGLNYYRLHIIDDPDNYYSATRLIAATPLPFTLLRVFPVPASGLLNLDIQSAENQTIQGEIVTSAGVVAQSFSRSIQCETLRCTIPVSNLRQGLYYIRLKTATSGYSGQTFLKN